MYKHTYMVPDHLKMAEMHFLLQNTVTVVFEYCSYDLQHANTSYQYNNNDNTKGCNNKTD